MHVTVYVQFTHPAGIMLTHVYGGDVFCVMADNVALFLSVLIGPNIQLRGPLLH